MSESEESDNNTKIINFNEFLYARYQKCKWKDLEFDTLDKKLALYKFDSLIDVNKQKIFDLWEHDFNINRSAHICHNLDFHCVYKAKKHTVSFVN